MKKILFLIAVILVFSVLLSACHSDVKYPSGRDTQQSYGDGTFQIIGRNPAGLFFEGAGSPVIPDLWCVYETEDNAYLLGQDYANNIHTEDYRVIFYGIIQKSNNTMQVFYNCDKGTIFVDDCFLQTPKIVYLSSFSSFLSEDQLIFKSMASGNIGYNPSAPSPE